MNTHTRKLSSFFITSIGFLFLFLNGNANASLIGDNITGCIALNNLSCSANFNATVTDPGVEHTLLTPFGNPQAGTLTTTIDFSEDILTINLINDCLNCGTSSQSMAFLFQSLDFSFGDITNIITLQNDFSLGAEFTANSLSLRRTGLFIFRQGANITSSFRIEGSSPVLAPAPSSVLLFCAGLLVLRIKLRNERCKLSNFITIPHSP